MSTVGRMDGAFFVSRTELLSWLNATFDLNVPKVELCANGAVYCQVIDACHPGAIQMKKVNWMARDEFHCVPNYKLLQQGFDKSGIQRHIDVDKLVRGKYQDNLEMLQWIKTYYERTAPGGEYDAASRRFGALPPWALPAGGDAGGGGAAGGGRPSAASCRPSPGVTPSPARSAPACPATSPGPRSGAAGAGAGAGAGGYPAATAASGPPAARRAQNAEGVRLGCDRCDRLADEVIDLKITLDGLERERDFYFQKLRDIEIFCQTLQAKRDPHMNEDRIIASVQEILYAKDDEDCDDPGPD